MIDSFYLMMKENDFKTFKKEYLKSKNDEEHAKINFEGVFNDIGYQLLRSENIEKAIRVFTLNKEEHSSSANCFDSLGEAYFMKKEYDLSIKSYKNAILLGGSSGNAKMMLEKINALKAINL